MISCRWGALALTLGACTVSNPPPPAYYPPPPPPQQAAPAPAPTPAPQPAPTPAPQPTPASPGQPVPPAPPAIDANTACIDGAGDIANEFDGAMALTVPSSTVICSGKRDTDVFTVTAPGTSGASLITYEIKQLNNEKLAPKITMFDANRKRDRDHNGRRSEHIRGWFVLQAGTSMYLRIGQVHGDEGKVALVLTATPLADAHEPNDTREQAKAVTGSTQGLMYRALNNKDATTDWYTFEVAKAGPVNFSIDMSEGIATKAAVSDANRKVVSRKQGGRGERIEWSWNAKGPGTYHLEVGSVHTIDASGRDDAASHLTRPYTLTIQQ